MNQFVNGAIITGVFGLTAVFAERKLQRPPKLHALTNTTMENLEAVPILCPNPSPDLLFTPNISVIDAVLIYLNSRGNRNLVNRDRVELSRPQCDTLLERVEADHSRIKRVAAACVLEKVTARLVPDCKSSNPRILLWTYADERGALRELASYCSDEVKTALEKRT